MKKILLFVMAFSLFAAMLWGCGNRDSSSAATKPTTRPTTAPTSAPTATATTPSATVPPTTGIPGASEGSGIPDDEGMIGSDETINGDAAGTEAGSGNGTMGGKSSGTTGGNFGSFTGTLF